MAAKILSYVYVYHTCSFKYEHRLFQSNYLHNTVYNLSQFACKVFKLFYMAVPSNTISRIRVHYSDNYR